MIRIQYCTKSFISWALDFNLSGYACSHNMLLIITMASDMSHDDFQLPIRIMNMSPLWFHWARLRYLACETLFCSILHATSYATGSAEEEHRARLLLSTCSDCVYLACFLWGPCFYYGCSYNYFIICLFNRRLLIRLHCAVDSELAKAFGLQVGCHLKVSVFD